MLHSGSDSTRCFIMERGERGRRNSSASEFFTRRNSSSFFQSLRRYSASQVFGVSKNDGGRNVGEGRGGAGKRGVEGGGRRHSAAGHGAAGADRLGTAAAGQSSPGVGRTDRWRHLAKAVLGNLEERNETDGGLAEEAGEEVLVTSD